MEVAFRRISPVPGGRDEIKLKEARIGSNLEKTKRGDEITPERSGREFVGRGSENGGGRSLPRGLEDIKKEMESGEKQHEHRKLEGGTIVGWMSLQKAQE